MDVLLDWITTEGNYRKWKGGMKHSGVSKESLCGLINGRMIDAGITHRKNDNIREKIKSLEAGNASGSSAGNASRSSDSSASSGSDGSASGSSAERAGGQHRQ
ncbi:hypothetical protein F444_23215 [Phytophthora nicotianae P1976]|uniref:Uncharacterized protein n=1 Tax=Phytophthora nicotianae P1976 TaxID=1317066 RepID=A0A080YVJ7_PHYNI|nr:hypothetical protein F444_23215 [Phytophthora nicotianae P1976]